MLLRNGIPSKHGTGSRGSWSARSEPQRAWDSFWLASHVLESPTGGAGFGLEMVSASSTEIEAEKGASEKGMLVNAPSHEQKLRRRGRPRKKSSKGEENHLSVKLSVCPPLRGLRCLPTGWGWLGLLVEEAGDDRKKHQVLPSRAQLSN
jgi:hypothetical protein